MRKALIYTRVSTEEQAKEGKSIETQISMCRRVIEDNGDTVLGTYTDDGKSGTDFNRLALQEMLLRCSEKDVSYLVVQDIDRLARDTFDYLAIKRELKKYGVEVVAINQPMINESPEGRFMEEILAASNALLPRVTGRKTKAIMTKKFEFGWWPSYAPNGYINVSNDNPVSSLDRNIVVPNIKIVSFIKQVFQEFSTGRYSVLTLTDFMESQGMRGPKGGRLQVSILHHILTNPFYWGLMVWGGMEGVGKHKPLISKELFDKCQFILARNRGFLIRERKYDFLLRSFIRCKQCGWRYVAEWHNAHSKSIDKVGYYHCSNKFCKPKKYIKIEHLETMVEGLFKDFEFSADFVDMVSTKAKEHFDKAKSEVGNKKQTYFNQKSALEAKRGVLEERLLDNTIDTETFRRLHTDLDTQIKLVDGEITKVEGIRATDFNVVEKVLGLTRDVYSTYKSATPAMKKRYLKFFFEKVFVDEGKIVEVKANPLFESLKEINSVILSSSWLPLVDMFMNHEIEFGFSLENVELLQSSASVL